MGNKAGIEYCDIPQRQSATGVYRNLRFHYHVIVGECNENSKVDVSEGQQ